MQTPKFLHIWQLVFSFLLITQSLTLCMGCAMSSSVADVDTGSDKNMGADTTVNSGTTTGSETEVDTVNKDSAETDDDTATKKDSETDIDTVAEEKIDTGMDTTTNEPSDSDSSSEQNVDFPFDTDSCNSSLFSHSLYDDLPLGTSCHGIVFIVETKYVEAFEDAFDIYCGQKPSNPVEGATSLCVYHAPLGGLFSISKDDYAAMCKASLIPGIQEIVCQFFLD